MLRWILRAALILCLASAQQNATSKFKTVPGPYDDLVGSQAGQAIVPLISLNSTDFVIGGLVGFTSGPGGPVSIKGVQRAIAFQCAVEALNANSTLNAGKTYYYQMVNDSETAPEAMNAAVYLINAGIQAVIGASSSATTLSAGALLTSFNLTVLGPSASTVELNNQQRYPTFLRFGASDLDQASAIAASMVYFNWSLITPIYTNDPYGLSGQSQFIVQAQNNRILLTCGRVINPGQLNGIQDTIRCLTNSDSSVILLWMNSENASNVIAALYNSGVQELQRLTFIAVDAWSNIGDFEQFSQGRFPESYLDGTLDFAPRLGDQQIFNGCLERVTPEDATIPNIKEFWETVFRCQLDPEEPLPVCPTKLKERPITANCTCDGSESYALLSQENAVTYYRDAVFSIGNAFTQLKENCTGLSEGLGTDFCNRTEISSWELAQIIQYNYFYGSTGLIAFDGNNRVGSQAKVIVVVYQVLYVGLTYEIRQRRTNGTLEIVGGYDGLNVTFRNSQLVWKDGTLPISAIVPQQVNIDSPIGIIFLTLTIIALIISITFSFLFWYYRDEKVVKKTSPFFSQLILIGIDLCLLSQIFWGVSQTSFTCFIKVWLLAIGFGLIMGNLLAKTYRIFKIFTNVDVSQMIIQDTDLLKFTGVVLAIEIALLSVYCFVSGTPRPINIQSTSDSLLLIIQCSVPSGFIQTFGTITLLVFNGLLILCGVVIAYVSRHVESSFNESKYIAITVYIYLLVVIILLPLYYTAGDSGSSVNRQYILRNISVLAAMYFTLVALFVPKIMNIYRVKRDEERKRRMTETGAGSTTQRSRIRSQLGGPTTTGSRGSQTDQQGDSLFGRMLTSQGSQGGSVSYGGGTGTGVTTGTMNSTMNSTAGSVTSDEARRPSVKSRTRTSEMRF